MPLPAGSNQPGPFILHMVETMLGGRRDKPCHRHSARAELHRWAFMTWFSAMICGISSGIERCVRNNATIKASSAWRIGGNIAGLLAIAHQENLGRMRQGCLCEKKMSRISRATGYREPQRGRHGRSSSEVTPRLNPAPPGISRSPSPAVGCSVVVRSKKSGNMVTVVASYLHPARTPAASSAEETELGRESPQHRIVRTGSGGRRGERP